MQSVGSDWRTKDWSAPDLTCRYRRWPDCQISSIMLQKATTFDKCVKLFKKRSSFLKQSGWGEMLTWLSTRKTTSTNSMVVWLLRMVL